MSNIEKGSFESITGEAALAARDAGVITEGVRATIDGLGIDTGEEEDDRGVTPKGDSLEKIIAKYE